MRIIIIAEGQTERAFIGPLRIFLGRRLAGKMPRLETRIFNGRVPKEAELRKWVENLLGGRSPADAVIALTDVYTGSRDFDDARGAKAKMRQWVGSNPRFFPHAAQYEFEAWLLPYWSIIQRLAKSNRGAPSNDPESVNHNNPPSKRIREVYQTGECKRQYSKARDAKVILERNQCDLSIAAGRCPELKAFLNTILTLCGAESLA